MKKVGIAGLGAIGTAVSKALIEGIEGYEFTGIAEANPPSDPPRPVMSFAELAEECDMVIECLPPNVAPELAKEVLSRNKELILISSSALLTAPEIKEMADSGNGRIIVPSGALAALDAVKALSYMGIRNVRIRSTKPPRGFTGAPFVIDNDINMEAIREKTRLFEGNAVEAARGFPANVNVAATLSLAGTGPENTMVEIWADPQAEGNSHEIEVRGDYSTITAKVDNVPDPANPKSSMLAAQSIVATLHMLADRITVI
jgi:aspartate dehydrogenase